MIQINRAQLGYMMSLVGADSPSFLGFQFTPADLAAGLKVSLENKLITPLNSQQPTIQQINVPPDLYEMAAIMADPDFAVAIQFHPKNQTSKTVEAGAILIYFAAGVRLKLAQLSSSTFELGFLPEARGNDNLIELLGLDSLQSKFNLKAVLFRRNAPQQNIEIEALATAIKE